MAQYEQGLINEHEYRLKQVKLMGIINQIDTANNLAENNNNLLNNDIDPSIEKLKIIKIKGEMTVNEFISSFKASSDIDIRIYNGENCANGDSTLNSLGYKHPKPIKFKLNSKMIVGDFEKVFKEKLGITILIEDKNGMLVDNSLPLNQI
jgi:hypothetical protein